MSKTDNRNQETLSDRLKGLVIVGIVLAVIYGINEVLWSFDQIIIMSVVTILVPIKFFVIVFRSWQLWIRENKKIIGLLFGLVVLVLAFIFDFETVPELWAYRLGVETQGKVLELRDKGRSSYVVYEFTADQLVYIKEQRVSFPTYESLEPGTAVPVKYMAGSPNVSFLVDPEQLKFQTVLVIFTGVAAVGSLYASVIKEKVIAIMKSDFQFQRPT
jgi:hypothetical protein